MSLDAEAFANRLRKNSRHLGKWARRQKISCYRIYDADLPDFALAIDRYEDHVHVQEYEAPSSIDPAKAQERLQAAMDAIPSVLELDSDNVHLKVRKRQRGSSQYQREDSRGEFFEVKEGGCRLLVNLSDYLDTGLFLDHRPIRVEIGQMASAKRFLNLFAYTASASVHAGCGGAAETTSVDMSTTYTEWAKRNLALNDLDPSNHRVVRANVLEWLDAANGEYDFIFLDPPTFSNSKKMEGAFDIQRDHVSLIQKTVRLLSSDGVLIFSNNHRRFALDEEALGDLAIQNITRRSIPKDFERNPRIHGCWVISGRERSSGRGSGRES